MPAIVSAKRICCVAIANEKKGWRGASTLSKSVVNETANSTRKDVVMCLGRRVFEAILQRTEVGTSQMFVPKQRIRLRVG